MPRSQQPAEGEKIIIDKILEKPKRWILDVGCGDGKWGDYLHGRVFKIDGVEICKKYIEKYQLYSKYDDLYNMDICNFSRFFLYSVVILGDVLEHLSHDKALALIDKLKKYRLVVYLTIPISKCIQDGTVYGNPHETHLYQWTHEELSALDFLKLHEGLNPNGLVRIGTYEMKCGT